MHRQYQGDVTLNGLHGNYRLIFDNGAPYQITTFNYPVNPRNHLNESGIYVQDTWRIGNRLTLNLGARYDRFATWVPPQEKEAGQFSEAGSFAKVETGTWQRIVPRLGFAFDMRGDGKTVLKGTYGLYSHTPSDSFAAAYNRNTPVTTTYWWHDLNANRDYDAGEVNLNTNSGDFVSISGASNNILNPDLRNPRTMQATASVEHELMPNFGARFSYFYSRNQDEYETVNVLRPYDVYTVQIVRPDPGIDGVTGTSDDGGNVTVWDYPAQYRGSAFVGNMPHRRSKWP
jgi:hypothetical protein